MKKSAGILLYSKQEQGLLFFLVHPGGPFWKNKDLGAWSIPKGEFTDEEPLAAALREFTEETGLSLPDTGYKQLNPVKMKSGKIVYAFALEHDVDASSISSNTFPLEWPPKSGKMVEIPEVDQAGWFPLEEALLKIIEVQRAFLKEVAGQV